MGVTLTGHISVPSEQLDAIRIALKEHIRLTRAEPGCISFNVTENPDHAGRFDVAEEFTDAAAFEAHQARVKASDWGHISAGLPRNYTITDAAAFEAHQARVKASKWGRISAGLPRDYTITGMPE